MIENDLCDLVGRVSKYVNLKREWNYVHLEGGYWEQGIYLMGNRRIHRL